MQVILWWLALQLIGVLALPLTWRLFARLPGRAYPFAKVLGLLLFSYVLWLGAIFHLIPNTLGGVVVSLVILVVLSVWVGWQGLQRTGTGARPLFAWLRTNRGLVLATELLFLLVLVGWSAFRAFNPDIAGTEKPMEFAFINGVLSSPLMPPQDPWLSGYGISYYYFGYVMLAALIRLTGVLPEIGFNLGVAMWYALAMTSAFGVVYTLVALSRAGWRPSTSPGELLPGSAQVASAASSSQAVAGVGSDRGALAASPGEDVGVVGSAQDALYAAGGAENAVSGGSAQDRPAADAVRDIYDADAGQGSIGWGLLGALMFGFMANLEGLIDTAYQRALLPQNFFRWIDIKDLTRDGPTGNLTGGFWWWWRASRVIHDLTLPLNGQRNSVEVIDEFPFFSFLLGDLHPHVLALPFVLLAILLCINLLAGALSAPVPAEPVDGFRGQLADWARSLAHATGLSWGGILLYAVAFGSLAFLNTWDFPIYVGLTALAFGVGLAFVGGLDWRPVGAAVFGFATLALLGYILYTPFYVGFQSQLGGILPNLLFPSRFSQFFIMFGPFLVITVAFLVLLSRQGGARTTARNSLWALPWTLLLPLIMLSVIVLTFILLPSGQAQVKEILQQPEIAANVADSSAGGLLQLVLQTRLGSPWTYLVLAVLLAWATGAVVAVLGVRRYPTSEVSETSEVSGATEASVRSRLHVPVDLFATLMIIVALALTLFPEFLYLRDLFGSRMNTVFKFYYQAWALLALAAAYGLSRLAAKTTPRGLKLPALVISVVLILGGLWYPLAAIPSKADNFQGQATLNGLAYLERSSPADVAAISWLRENVRRDAVVLEATGGSYSEDGRVSMSTGNPTLLGWDFHERQWRGNVGYDKLAAMRPDAIDQIYRSARPEDLSGLLDQWGVNYVYVGPLERSKYKVSDATLSRFDGTMTKVYDADGVRIYAR